jgi:hypothetical protein
VKIRILVIAIAIAALLAGGLVAEAQKRNTTTSAMLLGSLPESDAMALVNVRVLLEQAMPKMLAENPAKLAQANAEIDNFKMKTGIDPRQFDQLALGMHYTYPSPDVSKIESVVLARGKFDAAAFVGAGRIAANGKYREEKYRGKTIYIFSLDQQMKVFGLFNIRVGELAVSALSDNVLALGSVSTVKATIDAGKTRHAANQELIELASQDPNAVIGFGGNVTPQLLKTVNVPNDTIARDISTIRQVYGTVGVTEKDVEMFLAARTADADSARNLSGTLTGLKQLGAFFVGRLPAPKGTLARTALDNLKITTQGSELQIRTAVAQADIAPLLRGGE